MPRTFDATVRRGARPGRREMLCVASHVRMTPICRYLSYRGRSQINFTALLVGGTRCTSITIIVRYIHFLKDDYYDC